MTTDPRDAPAGVLFRAGPPGAGRLDDAGLTGEGHVGSSRWDGGTGTVARFVRLVLDGAVERDGVAAAAARAGTTPAGLDTALHRELGLGAAALVDAERLRIARLLLEGTDLGEAAVALAAGFDGLPALAAPAEGAGHVVELQLPFRPPLLPDSLFGHLAATAVPGVEEWRAGAYRRTLRLPHGAGTASLTPGATSVRCRLRLDDLRDLRPALARCRRLLDLDADPAAVDGVLRADPALGPVVAAAPGRRVPRTVDGPELAVRAVLGQQVSTAAARTHAGRLVVAHGTPVDDPDGGLTHLFPDVEALARVDTAALALPRSRRATMAGLVAALADGRLDLDPAGDAVRARAAMADLSGFGPWTVETVMMRAMADPDAFLPTDLGVVLAARRLGLPGTPAALRRHAERWRPWRSYAVQYLWATGEHPVNRLPPSGP